MEIGTARHHTGGVRPVIGISTYLEPARWGHWDRPAAFIPRSYVDGVVLAGGVPVLLPVLPASNEADAVRAVDGLVLSGGADIDPAHYGERPLPGTATSPHRDEWELPLLAAALDRRLPVLAICRGMQLLNVACGGTLHQHLPLVVGHEEHRLGPTEYGRTKVRIDPGSRLAGILGEEVEVHCHHHQALNRLGTGVVAAGWAGDGTVEAVEHADHDFVLGVQWHPEEDEVDRRLFEALVHTASARQEDAA